jgi:hypothetical protein
MLGGDVPKIFNSSRHMHAVKGTRKPSGQGLRDAGVTLKEDDVSGLHKTPHCR